MHAGTQPIGRNTLHTGLAILTLFGAPEATRSVNTLVAAEKARAVQLLAADFSSDGSQLIVAGDAVRVYESKTGTLLREIPTQEWSRQVEFSPAAGNVFATAGDRGVVRLRQTTGPTVLQDLTGHKIDVLAMDFSPRGRFLATGGVKFKRGAADFGEFRLWNAEAGRLLQSLTFPNTSVYATAFSPDPGRVAFARNTPEDPSYIDVYQITPWNKLKTIAFRPGFALSLSFTTDGAGLLIGGGTCIRAVDNSCEPTGRLWHAHLDGSDIKASPLSTERGGYFRSVSPTPQGDRFATCQSQPRPLQNRAGGIVGQKQMAQIQMRQLNSGKLLWSVEGNLGDPYGTCVSPGGRFVAGCSERDVLLIDAMSGELLWKAEVPKLQPNAG